MIVHAERDPSASAESEARCAAGNRNRESTQSTFRPTAALRRPVPRVFSSPADCSCSTRRGCDRYFPIVSLPTIEHGRRSCARLYQRKWRRDGRPYFFQNRNPSRNRRRSTGVILVVQRGALFGNYRSAQFLGSRRQDKMNTMARYAATYVLSWLIRRSPTLNRPLVGEAPTYHRDVALILAESTVRIATGPGRLHPSPLLTS